MTTVKDYITKFDSLLPVDVYFRKKISDTLEYMEKVNEFQFYEQPRSSNGSSVVFVGKTKTFQVFEFESVYQKIKELIYTLPDKIDDDDSEDMTTSNFLPLIRNQEELPPCTLVWKIITPLNIFTQSQIRGIIRMNFCKFSLDINKALHCLHKYGYIHNDCRIDNIGITEKGDFCLFDYGATAKGTNWINDFLDLNKSLHFLGIKHEVDKEF